MQISPNDPERIDREGSEYKLTGEQVINAILFTAMAAALYPVALSGLAALANPLLRLVNWPLFPLGESGIAEFYQPIVAGLFTACIGGIVGIFVVPLTFGLFCLAYGKVKQSTIAAIAGGNVAALCVGFPTYAMGNWTAEAWPSALTYTALAIFMGQLGGRFGERRGRNAAWGPISPPSAWTYRFTLRQLFALTTAICLATAGLRILATWHWQFAFCVVCAVLTQLALLPVTNFLASRLFLRWQRRTALPLPGGEPHPP